MRKLRFREVLWLENEQRFDPQSAWVWRPSLSELLKALIAQLNSI